MAKKKSKCIYQPKAVICRRKARCRNCQYKVGTIKVNGR